jgi:phenylacetic acid degradation protein
VLSYAREITPNVASISQWAGNGWFYWDARHERDLCYIIPDRSLLPRANVTFMSPNKRRTYSIDGVAPVIDSSAFVHPDAVIIGDVIIGADCYVGPGASLRGDFGRIILERGSNVQDNCILHSLPGLDLVIGPDGHIGHGAVIHGARVGTNAMVGMNSVIMDHAIIGVSSIIAAMSFVKSGAEIPALHMAAGIPARVVRELTDDELAIKIESTRQYQLLTRRCLASHVPVEALTHFDPNQKRVDANISLPLRDIARQKRNKPS